VRGEQVLLITGCSSGIGRATALEAARRGHTVFASARDPSTLRELQGQGSIRALALDVQDAASCRQGVQRVLEETGRLDALVNNAGFAQYGAVEEVSLERWQQQFDVNVFGPIRMIQAALPPMREARRGTIVNISSVAGKLSIPFAAPYCSTKHALEAISDALRVELSPFGIRVVVIEPGPIVSKFEERARREVNALLKGNGPYSRFYGEAERAMDSDFRRGELPAEAVARVVIKAVEARRPKTRYLLTMMSKTVIPLRRVLPDRYFDRQMKKVLKLPTVRPGRRSSD
jgi:NAD(P)-dependent dehydrogenase (short-subunit alcohol dehydrogenase family)